MENTNSEFEKICTLLTSTNEDSFHLGLTLAVHYQQEFEKHFGYTLKEYKKLVNLLILDAKYYKCGMSMQDVIRVNLEGKQLKKLPTEIKYLKNLQSLVLGHNQLTKFPKEILQLTKLEYVNLNHNLIKNIPKEINALHKLDYFRLDNNQIRIVPKEILQIEELVYLNLKQNPLSEKTKQMLSKRTKALKLAVDFQLPIL